MLSIFIGTWPFYKRDTQEKPVAILSHPIKISFRKKLGETQTMNLLIHAYIWSYEAKFTVNETK